MEINLAKVKKIYFVGIKGIAMASLAVYAKERGFVVSGTDTKEEFPSDAVLEQAKIVPSVGFDPSHIAKSSPDLVIYTGAHGGRDNIEVQQAITKGIAVLPHGKALGLFMTGKRQISVAGSHGKTTTSAMIATILSLAGLDPSYAIGSGSIAGLGLPGHFGHGDWFVAEADEYVTDPGHDATPRFLWQSPEVLVVTNIDYDHPDVYASLEAVISAFGHLRDKVPPSGEVVLSSDDPNRSSLIWMQSSVALVGVAGGPDYCITNIHVDQGRTYFQLETGGVILGGFQLQIPGKHNVKNAAMAAVAAHDAGVSWEKIQKGLAIFGGAKRRFEKIGEFGGVLFYDDYAHHPVEISATLASARTWYPKHRIIGIFQPHTYSRTKALILDFAGAFGDADIVITTDIYASAREIKNSEVTGASLAELVATKHAQTHFARNQAAVLTYLRSIIRDGDVVIFMGAGDIYQWGKEIIKEMINDK